MSRIAKPRKQRSKRLALVRSHLERVSRSLLEEHPDVVRDFIGRNAGVYALYKKDRLYYVGLATKLTARLKAHLRDRHGEAWDRFSIYLTIADQHIKDIECLLLQIARPRGNKVGGKPTGSRDMRRAVVAAIRQKERKKTALLFDRSGSSRKRLAETASNGETSQLMHLLPRGAMLKATNKGTVFRASVRPNGQVRFKGQSFGSLSSAAYHALNRPSNGWWFWQIEIAKGHWSRLSKIRKAGTPVYPR